MILGRKLKSLNLIELSQKQILKNFDLVSKLKPGVEVWPVLKSNAYGHGIELVAEILKERNPRYLIVDSYYEALKIWKKVAQPALIIGSIDPNNYRFLDLKRTTLTVQNREEIEALGRINKKVKVHLKINTGMNRQGFEVEELEEIVKILKQFPKIEVEGLFSHLADADNEDNSNTEKQEKVFVKVREILEKNGIKPKYVHLGATAGFLKVNDKRINALRLGIGLYGYNPLKTTDKDYQKLAGLKPVLRMWSTITRVRGINCGQKVGYNGTYMATEKIGLATIPVGYFEGLDRRLSNVGFVKCKNKFCLIAGRVSMNLTTIELKHIKANTYDKVEVISPKKNDKNSVANMAKLIGTIPYEILVHLNESIRREVID